jgi:putative membrane protein
MDKILFQVIAGALSLWLADKYVPGVDFTGPIQNLILVGAILGLLNSFLKPPIKLITLPLRILTLGLFNIIINMLMVWLVDIISPELAITGLIPLFWTSIIISLASLIFGLK